MLLGTTTTMQLFSYQGNYFPSTRCGTPRSAITTSHVLVWMWIFSFDGTARPSLRNLYLKTTLEARWWSRRSSGKATGAAIPTSVEAELSKLTLFPKPSPNSSIVWRPWRASSSISRGTRATEPRTRQIGSRPRQAAATRAFHAADRVRAEARPPGRTRRSCPRVCCRSRAYVEPRRIACLKCALASYVVSRNNADVRFDASYAATARTDRRPPGCGTRGGDPRCCCWGLGPRAASLVLVQTELDGDGRGSHETDQLYKGLVAEARDNVDARDGANRRGCATAAFVMLSLFFALVGCSGPRVALSGF